MYRPEKILTTSMNLPTPGKNTAGPHACDIRTSSWRCLLTVKIQLMHTFHQHSGSASTVKEPGHFEVRKSSSQVNIFIFCSHYYRSKVIGRAKPGQWIFQPGRLTWRALVYRRRCSSLSVIIIR